MPYQIQAITPNTTNAIVRFRYRGHTDGPYENGQYYDFVVHCWATILGVDTRGVDSGESVSVHGMIASGDAGLIPVFVAQRSGLWLFIGYLPDAVERADGVMRSTSAVEERSIYQSLS